MVRAILAGAKSQTRRIVNMQRLGIGYIGPRGCEDDPESWGYALDGPDHHGWMVLARGLDERHDHGMISIPCPYGAPGDRLWVRETWGPCAGGVVYRADDDGAQVRCPDGGRWTPSIHMPRWASRITLAVESVRVERVHDISEEDARAEGAAHRIAPGGDLAGAFDHMPDRTINYRAHFADLWRSINGAESWDTNPWVWVVGFSRVPA